VGRWLAANGEGIYGTTYSPIPDQPWGVITRKPGRLFLHVFRRPADGALVVPGFPAAATNINLLGSSAALKHSKRGSDLVIELPTLLPDANNTVVAVEFSGELKNDWKMPLVISRQFDAITLDAARAKVGGKALIQSQTHSHYFGNWKHDTCVIGQAAPDDVAEFAVRFTEPGDYRVVIEYACATAAKGREGFLEMGDQKIAFETVRTADYDRHQPLIFIRHSLGVLSVQSAGEQKLAIRPEIGGGELFWLRRVVIEPVR
jgi:alpha-L-fucosidase